MDTFSRKHRLRQLQLQKQQQQLLEPADYLAYDKENSKPFSHHHQHHSPPANGAAAMRAEPATLTRKCPIRGQPELEDNEFKVVRVIGLQEPISCDTSRFQAASEHKIHTPLKPSKPASKSLVRCHQQQQPTTDSSAKHLLSQHNHSSDSSGFSSSLYSTQVEIKHHPPATNTATHKASQSKLIDELDRLIMHVDGAASPGESYLSCTDQRHQDSTLVRSNECVNSSLCRDEFSSFIALTGSERAKAKRKEFRVECDNHYSTICESELSCDSAADDKWSMESEPKPDSSQTTLSTLLEQHVAKVQTLLRLASGDRNVSMVDAFGHCDIPVSEEFCIPFEFVASETAPSCKRIVHELEVVDLRDGEEFLEKASRYMLEGSQVPFICPLEFQLDWSEGCLEGGKQQIKLSQDLHSLKRSILQKLLTRHQEEALNKSLVSKVSEHVNEFIDKYVEFHNSLMTHTTFSSDWHENWLFSSPETSCGADGPSWPPATDAEHEDGDEDGDEGQIASKRARLSRSQSQRDLLRYSTLILEGDPRRRRRSLRYLTDQLVAGQAARGDLSKVDQWYEEQEEQMMELRVGKTNSSGLPDVCQLLLEEDYCGNSDEASQKRRQQAARMLQVSYESCIFNVANAGGHFSFTAYGYFIKTPLLISPNTGLMKLAQLRQRTLGRLAKLLKDPASRQSAAAAADSAANRQVGFGISVTSVELVNRLQVVQFCAQVTGHLPISVRWFRGSQEISRKSTCESTQTGSEWPVWFHANYDYQCKTEWSSWYRFRRNRDRILFEIRCPNKEKDYDVPYKCVVENYCSQAECSFSLKSRPLNQSPELDLNNNKRRHNKAADGGGAPNEGAGANKARAVLRTWSQRTLKPQARVLEDQPQASVQSRHLNSSGRHQSPGEQWSSEAPASQDKFGKDFPYHPENLLKRLRENMFSLGGHKKVAHCPSHQLEDYSQPVEQHIHFEPLEEPQSAHLEESPASLSNHCGLTQDTLPIFSAKDAPKPQDRLSKITAHVNQERDNDQSSCMVNHETSELNYHPNSSELLPNALNHNHKSTEAKTASVPSKTGQTGLYRDETSHHADSNGNYKLKTCVKSLISKFNKA